MFNIQKTQWLTAITLSSVFIAGCGSSSGNRPTDTRNYTAPPIIAGSNSSSITSTPPATDWTRGTYKASSTFANFCAAPRSGTNPYTGELYPDKRGTVVHENHFLRSWSDESYLWYDELPDLDPNGYSNPIAYFELLKTNALTANGNEKDKFHFTEDEVSGDQLTYTGEVGGYGFNWLFTGDGKAYITYVDAGSPAAQANISRGMQLVSIDNITLANVTEKSEIDTVNARLFPASGESHRFVFSSTIGIDRSVTLKSTSVAISPVYTSKTLSTAFGAVGYLAFNTFGSTIAANQLKTAFEQFSANGISDLVVDLRYNGGGYLYLSSILGYLTAGESATNQEIFATIKYNDKRDDEDYRFPFFKTYDDANGNEQVLTSLNLNRVYVLTTNNTCSASEYYINGLRGIGIEVVQIGSTTCGKPYGYDGTSNCGTRYFGIDFESVNAQNFGDFSDGFEPVASGGNPFSNKINGCKVEDDLSQPLGSVNEDMLAAALFHRENGRCPSAQSGIQKVRPSLPIRGEVPTPMSQKILRLFP